ncbi:hypothetical protein [Hahella ganghwensis]|uniref:hypothetical protein n=1 Tax=Hahella ganghwensis TaxID=286420 RepID=UPI00036CACAC|nr:hypothetical protein [Hahella ganghwensis]
MIDSKQPEFTEIQVDIAIRCGIPQKAPGITHKNSPGLAVVMVNFGLFNVTHIPTGMSLSTPYERHSSALLIMSEFALIAHANGFKWDELNTLEEARERISQLRDEPVPFPNATSTSQGVTRPQTISEWVNLSRSFFDEFPWEEIDPYQLARENLSKCGEQIPNDCCCGECDEAYRLCPVHKTDPDDLKVGGTE